MSDGAEEAWHLSLRMSSAKKCLLASVAMKAGFRPNQHASKQKAPKLLECFPTAASNASEQGKSNANTQLLVKLCAKDA